MASSALRFLTCLVTVCIVASVGAAISCGTVAQRVILCINYLTGREELTPACCRGLRDLNAMAQTTPDRQAACECLQALVKKISGFNPIIASKLPGKCGVSLPYPISTSANCHNVHLEDEEYMVYNNNKYDEMVYVS